MRPATLILGITLASLLCACGKQEPETTVIEEEEAADDITAHMQEHFLKVTAVREALVMGNLEAAAAPATWLAEHAPFAELPQDWERYLEHVRAEALEVVAAQDLDTASRATAQMAVACGDCHLQNGIADQFPDPPSYPEDETVQGHMQRHQWALERMWEGLITPSAVAWERGIDVFAEVPLSAHDNIEKTAEGDALETLARTVHGRAAMGFVADDASQRAEVFAEVLATCGTCHQRSGRGPAAKAGP